MLSGCDCEYYNHFSGRGCGFFKILTNPAFFSVPGMLLLGAAAMSCPTMSADEGMWSYMGRVWAEDGIVPYTGAVDNKPPGIFILFYLSHVLFGTNFWFPRIAGILSSAGTSVCLYLLIQKTAGRISGIIGMVLYICMIPTGAFDGPFTAHTETFMIFFCNGSISISAVEPAMAGTSLASEYLRRRIFRRDCGLF
jgi:hypothetical protein